MQFIADGPDVPLELLDAQERGKLALFCGAGISIPAGMPSFRGLVKRVYDELGAQATELEKAACRKGDYDRVLGLLESDDRLGRVQVRQKVAEILATPENPELSTHRALLDLARGRNGRLRLVTTNFDRLFEDVDSNIPFNAAPMLPVPKEHKWDSLVYLHGRLDEADAEGQGLVLTSSDFGIAYLTERWASRFVTELFRQYLVLFIGYRLGDPVMRYLMDAFAAERRYGQDVNDAYAFVDSDGDETEAAALWESRDIRPIVYSNAHDHKALHRTLQAWAGIWSGGLLSKTNIVRRFANKDPGSLSPAQLSQMCWAAGDATGANALAQRGEDESSSVARFEWLSEFQKAGLLEGPHGEGTPSTVPLVGDSRGITSRPPALDGARRGLTNWLCQHLSNPLLARWVVSAGPNLHPEVQERIRWHLTRTDLHPALRKIWFALTGSVPLAMTSDAYDRFGFYRRLPVEPWSPTLRIEVLRAVSPRLSIKSAWRYIDPDEWEQLESVSSENLTVADVLSVDCELAAARTSEMMVGELRAREDWSEIAADLAFDLSAALRRALDMMAALDAASCVYDASYIQFPSIADHPQNRHFDSWTWLIDLVRDAFNSLLERDPTQAQSLARSWIMADYPLFRRLVLYAAGRGGLPASDAAAQMVQDPVNWMWSSATRLELFRFLPTAWEDLSEEGREDLASLIVEGPPRPAPADSDSEDLRDRQIWERLSRLREAGASLPSTANDELRSIEGNHPEWRLSGGEREDFSSWMETRMGGDSQDAVAALDAIQDDDDLLEFLRARDGTERLDSWRQWAEERQERTLRLLNRSLGEGDLDPLLWGPGLRAFRAVRDDETLRSGLLSLLERLPADLLPDVSQEVVDALGPLARSVGDERRSRVLAVWDRALAASAGVAVSDREDRVSAAINHPVGRLLQELFDVLHSRALEQGQGIPDDIRERLARALEASGEAAQLGRVIIASRLPLLHALDAGWTRECVVPLFDWGRPDAIGAWQGYLWSPSIEPSIWEDLKPLFLGAFDHLDAIGEFGRNLSALLAAVAIDLEEGAISTDEARTCLRMQGDFGRETVAICLGERLKGAGAQAAALWTERIGPWIASAWPRELEYRGEASSERLAWVTTLAGGALRDAVSVVVPLLGRVESAHMIIDRLREEGHSREEPGACLDLLAAITPAGPNSWFGDLGAVLNEMRAKEPDIEANPEFVRLRELAILRGL